MDGTSISPARAPGLGRRRLEAELMDDPALDEREHHRALRALARVHTLSGTGLRIRRKLDRIAADAQRGRPLRVLDVACGGGDASLDAAHWGRRTGRAVEVTGLDLSGTALRFAGERARREGVGIDWLEGDALTDLPAGPFDLVVSSLFLHHLPDGGVVHLLEAVGARAAHVHIEDLCRSHLGLGLAWATLRLVSRSRVAHVDGPRSVRAAWRRQELADLADAAGLGGAGIRRGWPERWILSWSAP
jgi:2-polyprenyl-3-methyl-5-hydroxy-6-metoxy-1,4-benzoquinol methylase